MISQNLKSIKYKAFTEKIVEIDYYGIVNTSRTHKKVYKRMIDFLTTSKITNFMR